MQLLCQRDPKWAQVKLGVSNLTVGRYGCTTTCVSMLSDYFGTYIAPSTLAFQKNYYTVDGLLNWTALDLPGMQFISRDQGRDDAKILDSIRNHDKAVMLEVSNGSHWVVAIRKCWFSNSYIVADPWTGKTCDVIKVYKNITGAAYWVRK